MELFDVAVGGRGYTHTFVTEGQRKVWRWPSFTDGNFIIVRIKWIGCAHCHGSCKSVGNKGGSEVSAKLSVCVLPGASANSVGVEKDNPRE